MRYIDLINTDTANAERLMRERRFEEALSSVRRIENATVKHITALQELLANNAAIESIILQMIAAASDTAVGSNATTDNSARNHGQQEKIMKTGTARTLREARLGALTAMVAGCTAQPEKAEGGAKEELLRLMQGEDHQHGVEGALKSGLLAGRR